MLEIKHDPDLLAAIPRFEDLEGKCTATFEEKMPKPSGSALKKTCRDDLPIVRTQPIDFHIYVIAADTKFKGVRDMYLRTYSEEEMSIPSGS